jgi:hypothetical protein
MDIRVKPSALTDYALLSYRGDVESVSDTRPIVLPVPSLFNQVVRKGGVL